MSLQELQGVLPLLTHPLALAGYVLFLVVGLYRLLLESGAIAPLTKASSQYILLRLSRYAFVLALVAIVSGYAVEAWTIHVTQSNSAADSSSSISRKPAIAGVVVHEHSNDSIAGAEVLLVGSGKHAVTQSNGNFYMEAPSTFDASDRVRLRVSKPGFLTKDITVYPPVYDLVVALEER